MSCYKNVDGVKFLPWLTASVDSNPVKDMQSFLEKRDHVDCKLITSDSKYRLEKAYDGKPGIFVDPLTGSLSKLFESIIVANAKSTMCWLIHR